MFPPFPQEKAKIVLESVLSALKDESLSIIQVAKVSEERKNQGIMLGALVCLDKDGNEVNLVANSGNSKAIRNVSFSVKDFSSRENGEDLTFGSEKESHKSSLPIPNLILVSSIVSAADIEGALAENDLEIHSISDFIKEKKIEGAEGKLSEEDKLLLDEKKSRLKELCSASLEKVHSLYNFHCIDGRVRSLKEICALYNQGKLPPTGTGDCCEPKLLNYAFSHDLKPISMAEIYYDEECLRDWSTAEGVPLAVWSESGSAESLTAKPDRPNDSTFHIPDFSLVPPCDERCGILLPAMTGLRILWQDENICIVNKQSGLLSVPGRGEDKQDCIESRFKRLFGERVEIKQPAVHRLDMETSGIMILAFTKEAHRLMNRQFEEKKVHKEYIALLDGVLSKKGIAPEGEMELFFRLNVDNRPHQIWDRENGKSAITQWKILGVERYHGSDGSVRNASRVLFMPHTGRTHQLRLASADSHGFGVPIIGDTLYGKCDEGERLMLHASKITFTHPISGEEMSISCPWEF